MIPTQCVESELAEAIVHNTHLPIDKLSRWLGYVQHYVINKGYTTVEDERNFSRPLFHSAYADQGTNIPETLDINIRNSE